MRLAHLAALAAAMASHAWAQAHSGNAAIPPIAQADSAQAPTAPLRHAPLAASGALADGTDDWKAANAAVAQFPRGHADIVRWEAAQHPAGAPAMPHGRHQQHQQHHGQHGQHGGRP